MRLKGLVFVLALSVALRAFAAEPSTQPADIAAAARQTQVKLKTTSASWTLSFRMAQMLVKTTVIQSPHGRRFSFSVDSAPNPVDLGTIIDRDGFWYVTDNGVSAKYRPFEAPMSFVQSYLMMQLAMLQFADDDPSQAGAGSASAQNGVVTYRMPLDPASRDYAQKLLNQMNAFVSQNPEAASNPKIQVQVQQITDLLKNGTNRRVDAASGIVVGINTGKWELSVTGFRWLDSAADAALRVDDKKWQDKSDDPTGGDPNDLLAIANHPAWQPGQPAGDLHPCIIDLHTGAMRRIPFQGAAAMPGSFSRDRKSVFVAGAVQTAGQMGIYEVNLQTRQNQKIAPGILATGMSVFPVLSPDGKSLLVMHKSLDAEQLLEWQPCVVDLKTQSVQTIGKPIDAAFFSWLPDQSGFILVTRKSVDMNKPAITTVSHLDMNGNVTAIREGDCPLLLPDGKTILFEDGDTNRVWETCDMSGQNIKLFRDGLPGHGFPSLSPDGKRIVFMKFDPQTGPRPVIYNLDHPNDPPTPVTDLPGLWAMPAWN